jgi:anti-sigma regulatory factor (Ser/Thr protein kinase)
MAPGVARERSSTIGIKLLGILEHRDVALRAVSAACKLVAPAPHGSAWHEFHAEVISAVGEAFNNVVIHAYQGRTDGMIDLRIRTEPGRIRVDMRDWGTSFDPQSVPSPTLDTLPESGLGLFIMQSFMDLAYRRGRPNLLTLTKQLPRHPRTAAPPAEGPT